MTENEKATELFSALWIILKRGNVAEVKRVGNEMHIVEIERKIKYRVTVTTG